jgi:hypothetical protein
VAARKSVKRAATQGRPYIDIPASFVVIPAKAGIHVFSRGGEPALYDTGWTVNTPIQDIPI